MVPEDVLNPLRIAQHAAENHADKESNAGQHEHAHQWRALAGELTNMIERLFARSEELERQRHNG